MSELAQFLVVHPTSITNAVDLLQRDGLVLRTAHPSDRRTSFVSITEEGREMIRRLQPLLEADAWGLSGVTRATLVELITVLRKVRGELGEAVGLEAEYEQMLDPNEPLLPSPKP